ncbi:MAG: DUF1501 domain-containing protein [Planctomycetes bacterium]|nr:DUF1501 domain-containing protein [Planctomycetota bacterium]
MAKQAGNRCRGPIGRRDFLRVGALALGGLTLTDVVKARANSGAERSDTSVILLYLSGGPSHLETYDLKPNAPIEYRSVFDPIRTNVPGIDVCEYLTGHARVADKFALIRSVRHTMTSHSDGGIEILTGKTPSRPDPTSTSSSEHPDFGAIASWQRGYGSNVMPPYVAVPGRIYMVRPSYLGPQHGPLNANDPSQPNYRLASASLPYGVDSGRLDDRRALRDQFDQLRRDLDASGQMNAGDQFRRTALQMLTSQGVARAFDIQQENASLRDRYGRNPWGQGCLLARRLAEAGTAVTTIVINTPFNGEQFTNWDDHIQNAMRPGHFGYYMSVRLPYYDQALSALIEDIYMRGLDEKIMVVAMGEFGRTPRLSHNAFGTGRDHWPDAMSVLISGGGLQMGQIVGATNARGEYPAQRPLTPKDILATIYRHLGIDTRHVLIDHTGRPNPILAEGTPIAELG